MQCILIADLPRIDYVVCDAYRKYLRDAELSPSSIAVVIGALRSWFNYLGRKGYILDNPASGLHSPRIPELLPHTPTASRMEEICDSVDAHNSSWPARDRAMLEMLYDTGAEAEDFCALNLADIDWAAQAILIGGSGKGARKPLDDSALESLRTYCSERAARLADKGWGGDEIAALFLNAHLRGLDKPESRARLTTRSVHRILKRIAAEISPRVVRAACGVHMAANGADIETVRAQLGYQGFRGAERIMRAAAASLPKAMQAHPRAQLEIPVDDSSLPAGVSVDPAAEANRTTANTTPTNKTPTDSELPRKAPASRSTVPVEVSNGQVREISPRATKESFKEVQNATDTLEGGPRPPYGSITLWLPNGAVIAVAQGADPAALRLILESQSA